MPRMRGADKVAMGETFELLIPGAPAAKARIPVTAPFDGKQLAEVPAGDSEHAEQAIATAHRLYLDRDGWIPIHRRVEILDRAAALLKERHEELAVGAAAEGGKPLRDSRAEVTRAIDGVKLCIETLRSEQGHVIPMGGTKAGANRIAFTQREPIGVVVAVSAFNHPLNLIVHQVATAVAAGCPVIVKPADVTPLSCFRFVQILHEAGLPPEWCQSLITTDNDVAQALVTDPRVAFFTFIGSAKVGWMLRSKLAPGTRCALEHGGAAPLILAQDADLDDALPAIAKGAYYHAGQVCVSVQRVFAHRSIASDFAGMLAKSAGALTIGDPTSADTDIGPLIRHAEVTRVHEWVTEAVRAGAKQLIGGDPVSESCFPCTLLYNPPADAKVSQLEIFGPVVCIYEYDNLDDAITRSNELPYAFQAAIYTRNLDTALRAYRRLDAAAVMVNGHTAFRVDGMPFAGLRHSGLGIGGIPYTMHDMTIEKLMVIRSGEL